MFKKNIDQRNPLKNLTPHFVFMKSNEVKHHQIHHCMALKSSIFDKNEPLSYHFTQKFSFFELVWTIFQRKYLIYEIFTQRADFILSAPLNIGAHRRAKRGCILARILDLTDICIEKNQSIKGSDLCIILISLRYTTLLL